LLLRGPDAPIAEGPAHATFAGETLAIGEIEAGSFHPRKVFRQNTVVKPISEENAEFSGVSRGFPPECRRWLPAYVRRQTPLSTIPTVLDDIPAPAIPSRRDIFDHHTLKGLRCRLRQSANRP
jgi:hypothetical protein